MMLVVILMTMVMVVVGDDDDGDDGGDDDGGGGGGGGGDSNNNAGIIMIGMMIYMATLMRMITMMMIPYTSLSLQQLLLWLSQTDLHNQKQIMFCLILSDCTLFLVTPVETALAPNKGTVSQAPGLL